LSSLLLNTHVGFLEIFDGNCVVFNLFLKFFCPGLKLTNMLVTQLSYFDFRHRHVILLCKQLLGQFSDSFTIFLSNTHLLFALKFKLLDSLFSILFGILFFTMLLFELIDVFDQLFILALDFFHFGYLLGKVLDGF